MDAATEFKCLTRGCSRHVCGICMQASVNRDPGLAKIVRVNPDIRMCLSCTEDALLADEKDVEQPAAKRHAVAGSHEVVLPQVLANQNFGVMAAQPALAGMDGPIMRPAAMGDYNRQEEMIVLTAMANRNVGGLRFMHPKILERVQAQTEQGLEGPEMAANSSLLDHVIYGLQMDPDAPVADWITDRLAILERHQSDGDPRGATAGTAATDGPAGPAETTTAPPQQVLEPKTRRAKKRDGLLTGGKRSKDKKGHTRPRTGEGPD
jgi:hypothetical protein